MNLEGDKLSTSRNHAVWLHEYLEDLPGRTDELRYVLTSISPETKDADFTWKDYQQKVNSELVAILGNFVNRVMVLTWKYFDGKVPSDHALPGSDDTRKRVLEIYEQTHQNLDDAVRELTAALKTFRFREAQFHMMNLARHGNKFLADTEPWKLAKTDMEAVGCILNYALTIVANIGLAAEPFLPQGAAAIFRQLNAAHLRDGWLDFWKKEKLVGTVPAGHQLGEAALLYRNVEDEEIRKQTDKLAAAKQKNAGSPAPEQEGTLPPLKSPIVFDDFAKLDIRVGKVLTAEKMPRSDKLLKLLVDTGIDQRTILSGIARHYTPEQLIGRQVTLVANLAPRKMMGVESQGMILMAEDKDGSLKLIEPSEAVSPGAQVS